MNGFLDRMAQGSRERVADAVVREPFAALRARALATPTPPALRFQDSFGLIAEYKRHSPSAGRLGSDNRLAERTTAYASAGACAVSVLTEPSRFHGTLSDLAVAAVTATPLEVPVMRKDFLVDPYQLVETRAAGAGGALLIVRLLSDARLREMLDCAYEFGLFVLIECFDAEDIRRAAEETARRPEPDRGSPLLLGINCRDLQTLEVRPQRFRDLASLLSDRLPRVAESGLATPDDCADVARNGYDMALIGSALMKAPDPEAMIRTMLAAARAATRAAA